MQEGISLLPQHMNGQLLHGLTILKESFIQTYRNNLHLMIQSTL